MHPEIACQLAQEHRRDLLDRAPNRTVSNGAFSRGGRRLGTRDKRRVPLRWLALGSVAVVALLGPFMTPVLAGAFDTTSRATGSPLARGHTRPVPSTAGIASSRTGTGGHSAPAIGPGKTTITYCVEGRMAETLDVSEPTPLPKASVPVVVYVHGGGWVKGDSTVTPDSLVGQVASAVEARGWVFISINYRLAPGYRWPAQIEDAKCALRFLRANAVSLHIDPRHIGAIGDSAGGQIVSLLGLAGRSAGFDTGQYRGQTSAVEAVVDLYGPADLTTADWTSAAYIEGYARQAFNTTLGPGPAGSPSNRELVAASPVTYVRPHEPPFLIIQGDGDRVVPPDQSLELADRLRAAGNSPTLEMVEHAQHGLLPLSGGPITPGVSSLATQASAFLVRHLGPSSR